MNGVAWGGSEQLWSETALRLRARGHRVSASVLRWPVRPAPLDELMRHEVHLAFRPRRRGLAGRLLQKCLRRFSPGELTRPDRAWLKRRHADLVVISQGGPWDGIPWMIACRELDIPYCTIVQANSEQWWPLDERLPAIETALSGAQRVYFVSHANRRLMELQCGRQLPNAEVISNPCKVDRTAAVPWPADEPNLKIACVGRLSPHAKGQDALLEVLARPQWRERPIELHLYGTGPSEQSVKSLAAFFRLTNVFFHGQVSDIRGIWAANHLLVLPSRFEGLPLTIIEAMLCGRPVVTTAVAGNTEVVNDGVNGFVAGAATPSLLDEAMERAWSRRREWRAMGESARTSVLAALPEDPVADFTGKLLQLAVPRTARRKDSAFGANTALVGPGGISAS